jgi:Protein of unknown function (DUF1800)
MSRFQQELPEAKPGQKWMERHTLSVNGGYSQHDVTELARVLTGWTLQPLEQGAAYQFDPRKHDPGDKVVWGHTISENGVNEGMQVLDILAHHPSTAKFISKKLCTARNQNNLIFEVKVHTNPDCRISCGVILAESLVPPKPEAIVPQPELVVRTSTAGWLHELLLEHLAPMMFYPGYRFVGQACIETTNFLVISHQ